MAGPQRQNKQGSHSGGKRSIVSLLAAKGGRKKPKSRGGKRRRPASRKVGRWALFSKASYWSAVSLLWLAMGTAAALFFFALDLPDTSGLWEVERSAQITILDRHGKRIARRGGDYGLPVSLDELPPHVAQAVIATEDRRFYHHIGIDPLGLMRAMSANIAQGRVVQGGSTITQQLAKNLFLTPERTIKRKIQEVMLALWLEQRFTKDQILSLYLNRVYLGAGTYGIEAASRRYFNKGASDLSLVESALIAGLLKAPSRYAPTNSQERARKRADIVLDAMVDAHFISAETRVRAALTSPRFAPEKTGRGEQYFVDWVLERLPGFIGEPGADLIVDTTLDLALQRQAEKAIALTLERDGKILKFSQAALLSMGARGDVRTMVGGRSYNASQFNRAVHAKRQPGSAFKPFVYLAGLEAGLTPQSLVEDAPIRIGSWAPKNFSDTYRGMITLTEALSGSVNTAAVRISERAGRRNVVSVAKRLGVVSSLTANPSLALGTSEVSLFELTGAYVPFANGGRGVVPHSIVRVRTGEGGLLYERSQGSLGNVVRPQIAAQMNAMLSETVISGTGRKARLAGHPAGGKTGTSQGNRDAWFVGYTSDLITGVWVGNDDFTPMGRVTGGRVPTVIWKDYMTAALRGAPVRPLYGSGQAIADAGEGGGGNVVSRFFSRIFGGTGPDEVSQ